MVERLQTLAVPEVLLAVTRILSESATLSEGAAELLAVVGEGLGWDCGELWRADPSAKLLRCVAGWSSAATGPSAPSREGLTAVPDGGLLGRVVTSGRPERTRALAGDPLLSGFGSPENTEALAIPVVVRGGAAAVMVFSRRGVPGFDDGLIGLAGEIGSRIGQLEERERTESVLRRLVKAVETIELGVTITDLAGTILFTNPAEARMHGYTVEEMIGMSVRLLAPSTTWQPVAPGPLKALKGWRRESVNARKDGSTFPVQLTSDAVPDHEGHAAWIVTCCVDITDRRKAEEALRSSEERYRLLFERNLAGVYRRSLDGGLLECNEAFARILGFDGREEVLAHGHWDFFVTPADGEAALRRLMERGVLTNFELRLNRRDGTTIWVLENETLLRREDGGPEAIEGTLIDITDRKRAEEEIEFHAYHDVLTGLPNRMLLKERLQMALARPGQQAAGLALMFLDLDNFKTINDTLGHSSGDRLLQAVAERLRICLRGEDTVARVGGDEFILLFPRIRRGEDASRVARKVLDSLADPFRIDGRELHVTASLGIARYPADGEDAEALLKCADGAMYRAKEAGRNDFKAGGAVLERRAVDQLTLENDLRRAVERGEMQVLFQPQLDLKLGRIAAAEALVRWTHPVRGEIGPAEFIPVAEELGVIVPLGEWVLRRACEEARRWNPKGAAPRVAVNLSPRQLQGSGPGKAIARILKETGLPPDRLELEITESIAMRDVAATVPILKDLVARGITIAIDDFGTGHSALSYLRLLPVHRVKIDQSFIHGVGRDARDNAIVRAIVGMAHTLGLVVTAEGVETVEQCEALRELECDEIQGHLVSVPVTGDVLAERLGETSPALSI